MRRSDWRADPQQKKFCQRGNAKIFAERDTGILDDYLTSTEFEYVMEKIKHILFAYYIYGLNKGKTSEILQEHDTE